MPTETLAIDFGTSNSAAAMVEGNGVRRIPIEDGADTLPTAVFFPVGKGRMQLGDLATRSLIDGEEGRYMRALKSALGLPLLHETRMIGGRRRSIGDIISDFLAELRQRAEAATGKRFTRALSGRPVHFHSDSPDSDAQAEQDLRACYLAAGFEDVSFLAEPEAAAIASLGLGAADEIGLIVDIGGGTSDFSVFRNAGARPEILASHGIRLGGTNFDYALSMARAMPLLGLDGKLRREMGDGLLPSPREPFVDLATWARIPFLYTPETRRLATEMAKLAVDRQRMERLGFVLKQELGHELAFAVERCKIAVSDGEVEARLKMGFIEPGLSETVSQDDLAAILASNRAKLGAAAAETLAMAKVSPDQVGRVILVGGSSLMGFVSEEIGALCPEAEILRSEAFTAVVDGLALATRG